MSEWRDIASAPRDGTWILAVVKGEWRPGVPFVPNTVMWGLCPISERHGWLEPNRDYGTETLTDAAFTHWQPLSEGPK